MPGSMIIRPPTLSCTIEVYRDGVFSAMGHDLVLDVAMAELTVSAEHDVTARFDAGSLRVVAAKRDGQLLPQALSPADRRKIEAAIQGEILSARAHPEIRFYSDSVQPRDGGWAVGGRLEIAGNSHHIDAVVRREDADWVARVPIVQTAFHIRPYTALLGALRVKDRVDVEIRWRGAPETL